jgi:hypothetical protein
MILYKEYILFRVVKYYNICIGVFMLLCCYGIISVGTAGVTKRSAAFDPHADMGPVLLKLKAKRLQLRRDTLTRDLGSYTFEAPCN